VDKGQPAEAAAQRGAHGAAAQPQQGALLGGVQGDAGPSEVSSVGGFGGDGGCGFGGGVFGGKGLGLGWGPGVFCRCVMARSPLWYTPGTELLSSSEPHPDSLNALNVCTTNATPMRPKTKGTLTATSSWRRCGSPAASRMRCTSCWSACAHVSDRGAGVVGVVGVVGASGAVGLK